MAVRSQPNVPKSVIDKGRYKDSCFRAFQEWFNNGARSFSGGISKVEILDVYLEFKGSDCLQTVVVCLCANCGEY